MLKIADGQTAANSLTLDLSHRPEPNRRCMTHAEGDGGARRDRTDDLMLAKHALSQLSYGPEEKCASPNMVGLGRLERPTSPLSGVRSNHLSYRPESVAPMGTRAGSRAQVTRRQSPDGKRNEDGGVPQMGSDRALDPKPPDTIDYRRTGRSREGRSLERR